MKKTISLAVICLVSVGMLISCYHFWHSNFRAYNASVDKDEMINFFLDNEQLFVGIKDRLDDLGLEYITAQNVEGEIIFRSYYEKDKDDRIEVDDSVLRDLCSEFYLRVKDNGFVAPTITYCKNAREYVRSDGIYFEFSYEASKKSAVETGIAFMGSDEQLVETEVFGNYEEIRKHWFYYFHGLV